MTAPTKHTHIIQVDLSPWEAKFLAASYVVGRRIVAGEELGGATGALLTVAGQAQSMDAVARLSERMLRVTQAATTEGLGAG